LAFAGSGGIADLLLNTGKMPPAGSAVLKMADADAMASLVLRARPRSTARVSELSPAHDFGTYTATLLRLARPDLLRISVIVPSFNYAHYLNARLTSIFAQTYPVLEILVLDDGSSDDSPAVARRGRGMAPHHQSHRKPQPDRLSLRTMGARSLPFIR